MLLPTLDLLAKVLNRSNVVCQALPRQHREFDLGDIQPTRMLRGVVDLQAVDQGFGLLRQKHFIERGWCVRIEVIHHQDDFLGIGILLFKHLPHEQRPILLSPVFGYLQIPFAAQRLVTNEKIATAPFLLSVIFSWPPPLLSTLGSAFVPYPML